MQSSTLVEHVADWHTQLRVDRTNRIVRNVALTGGTSKNGYRYSEQALQAAVPLYEQRPVFLDHAADKSRPQERSTRDLVGSIINPRYESGRIRGDIRVLDTDSGRTFLALSESDAPGVGMSHVVLAERSQPDGAVNRIHDVVSVDAVVFPATTTTFRESRDSIASPRCSVTENAKAEATDNSPSLNHESSDSGTTVSAAVCHSSTTCGTEQSAENLDQRLNQLLVERDELLTRLDEVQRRQTDGQRKLKIAELLSEAGLPSFAVTETFRRQLMAADDMLRRELIQERQQLIATARQRPPVSGERSAVTRGRTSDADFVAALRRSAS